jgi:hypothetical protein
MVGVAKRHREPGSRRALSVTPRKPRLQGCGRARADQTVIFWSGSVKKGEELVLNMLSASSWETQLVVFPKGAQGDFCKEMVQIIPRWDWCVIPKTHLMPG